MWPMKGYKMLNLSLAGDKKYFIMKFLDGKEKHKKEEKIKIMKSERLLKRS